MQCLINKETIDTFILPEKADWKKTTITLDTSYLPAISSSAVLYDRPLSPFGFPAHSISVYEADLDKVSSLKKTFNIRGEKDVEIFLTQNQFLLPLVLEAHEKIKTSFGENVPLSLELVVDPEDIDSHELFLFAGTRLSPQEALTKLAQLDKDWWLANVSRAQGRLNIDVEFL